MSKDSPRTFTTGQTWGALRKAWMKEYSEKIRNLQAQLGVPQSTFASTKKKE